MQNEETSQTSTEETQVNKRKSSVRDLLDYNDGIDLSEFTKPYEELKKDYSRALYFVKKKEVGQAYIVTFTDDPNLFFIAFAPCKKRDKVRYAAIKYFHLQNHPDFITRSQTNGKYKYARRHRCPDFDRYADEKIVPVSEIMRIGVPIPCCYCRQHQFTYEDYLAKRCYALEDEGNLNVFTKGIILCRNCYEKLFGREEPHT